MENISIVSSLTKINPQHITRAASTVFFGFDLSQSKSEHPAITVKANPSQNGAALDCNTEGKPGEGKKMRAKKLFYSVQLILRN